MKRLCTILSFVIFTMSVYAQNNVFVLVDVSGSISPVDLANSKQTLVEVLTNSPLSMAKIKGPSTDLSNFKLNIGDKLSVSLFGSCPRTWNISPSLSNISNIGSDVSNILNTVEWRPILTDNTFIQLAKAKIAEFAVRNRITNYKLIIITDNIQTDFAKGKLSYCNKEAKDLAESYKSGSNPVIEGVYTLLKYNLSADFTITLIQSVDASNFTLPGGGNSPSPSPSPIVTPSIILTSLADGKKDNPKPTNSNSFPISWTCNCPAGTTFNLALTGMDGKFKDLSKKNIPGNLVIYTDVPSGIFKISVTASNVNNVKPAFTFVETPSSDYGLIVFLLVLIVAGAVGYYFWNKKRQKKVDLFTTNKADDIFSKASGGATTGNSSNSDYF